MSVVVKDFATGIVLGVGSNLFMAVQKTIVRVRIIDSSIISEAQEIEIEDTEIGYLGTFILSELQAASSERDLINKCCG